MTQIHPLESLYFEELYQIPAKVLIVISKPWSEIPENERTLLSKILGAIKLSLSSVQIINRGSFTAGDFGNYRPSHIIAFGAALKNSSKTYEMISEDGSAIVLADALDQLDDVRKRNLWLVLKQVFHS